ncbi:hypothetical protein GGS23DRAFT_563936 [Durotheca rogersii]|uniref:uncharacterized protein n=1 Tax=Durotheca rogersii TaxID=419775 RepID=UPI00221F572E|nr:uncharacterized protein GGS23DRAFT_563936 [Durotheca rogersii]KAI5864342.1 hypothetical protein GGS23DRAFT_563936 [Durotheca rogersii]
MADPLLTSLCTICRIQPPKYRCPRCGTRTCSLVCVSKHKKWSSCNGERDPTVYIPREKLKTDAGIDHDYNFLTKIERAVERAERILREDREILPQDDTTSRPPPNKRARLHKGRSRGRVTFDENARRWDRNSIQRTRQLGIHVSSVPYGMARAKENKTSWNKRKRSINWQVEWLEWKGVAPTAGQGDLQPSRTLHKLLDEVPLCVGFAEGREHCRQRQLSDEGRARDKRMRALEARKRSTGGGQDVATTAWSGQDYALQDPGTAAWDKVVSGLHTTEALRDRWRFFFLKPRTPSREAQKLIPLRPTDPLAVALSGLDVVEFPTICVLPAGSTSIPDGYVVESRPAEKPDNKRQGSSLVESSSEKEDGATSEGPDHDEGEVEEDTTSSSGTESDLSDT